MLGYALSGKLMMMTRLQGVTVAVVVAKKYLKHAALVELQLVVVIFLFVYGLRKLTF